MKFILIKNKIVQMKIRSFGEMNEWLVREELKSIMPFLIVIWNKLFIFILLTREKLNLRENLIRIFLVNRE